MNDKVKEDPVIPSECFAGITSIQQNSSRPQGKSFFERFDTEYMRPIFGGPSSGDDNGDDTDIHMSPLPKSPIKKSQSSNENNKKDSGRISLRVNTGKNSETHSKYSPPNERL